MIERIDAHSHFLPARLLERLRSEGDRYGTPVQTRDGKTFVVTPERPYGPIVPSFYDVEARKHYMDSHGISLQVLAPPPFLFYYWIDAEASYAVVRAENEAIAEVVASNHPRFAGLGTVPMHHARMAVRECETIRTEGLSGIEIGSNVNGIDLDDERFWPVYEAAESLGLPILIHPNNVVGGDRVRDFHLQNLIGFPCDTTLAAARLIFTGVLDRFPRLRICLGQAGGFLPYIYGRLDHGYSARPECRRFTNRRPSEYLRRFYYDTIIHAPGPLAYLIQTVGADRMMLGSDFPFDMAAARPIGDIDSAGLSDEQRKQLDFETACEFLGIDHVQ